MAKLWIGRLWGLVLPLLLGCSLWLAWKTKGFALRNLLRAVGWTLKPGKRDGSGVSPFACLCTALASTVGSGNIVGVAFALTAGGPGALVWMWITAAIGTAAKYAECAQAVLYRRRTPEGSWLGGTMVTLTHLPRRQLGLALGSAYAVVEIVATLTANSLVQSSAIAASLTQTLHISPFVTGMLVGGLTLAVLSGGVKSVARFSSALVPGMLLLYLFGGVAVLAASPSRIPGAVAGLFRSAFDLRSMGAGAFGAMVRTGVARGCFSNESGTGTAGFSAALSSAGPVRQGLISSTANLWDTGIICSVTGLAVLVSGCMDSGLTGVELVMAAYRTGLGAAGNWIVGLCLVLFAFSSLPGLAFQGEQAMTFLTRDRTALRLYRVGFSAVAAVGCLVNTEPALLGADFYNAILVLLNLIPLLLLPCPTEEQKLRRS